METAGSETFDITAERDGKLFTFGAGAHYCLGGIEGICNVESLPLRRA